MSCAFGTLPIVDLFNPPLSPQVRLRVAGSGQVKASGTSQTADPDPTNNDAVDVLDVNRVLCREQVA